MINRTTSGLSAGLPSCAYVGRAFPCSTSTGLLQGGVVDLGPKNYHTTRIVGLRKHLALHITEF